MPELRKTAESIFHFVKETALSDLHLERVARRCEFSVSPRQDFNAFVSIDTFSRKPRYFIELAEVIADRISAVLEAATNSEEALISFGAPAGKRIGLDDSDRLRSLILISSLFFITFHELGHATAGHLRYWQEHSGDGTQIPHKFDEMSHFGFGMAEIPGNSLNQEQSIYRRIMELEADGLALEVVHEFRRELAMLVVPESMAEVLIPVDEVDTAVEQLLERSTLTGALLSVSLLENERAKIHEQRETSHPFPEARLFNLLMRPIAIGLGDKRRIVEGEERVSYSDPEARAATMHVLRQIVAPTLSFLLEAARLSSVEVPGAALLIAENFLTDVKTLITEGTASATLGGREIAMLNNYKSQYIQRLETYRDVDWWKPRS